MGVYWNWNVALEFGVEVGAFLFALRAQEGGRREERVESKKHFTLLHVHKVF